MILQVLNTKTNNLINLKFDNGVHMMRHIESFCDDRHQLSVVQNGNTVLRGRDEIMQTSNFF
jgi:hypothetical protein